MKFFTQPAQNSGSLNPLNWFRRCGSRCCSRIGLEGRFVLSFKFIAIAYGMLGATAATGYMVQGGGGNGAAGKRPTSGHVAEAPKVERVAKLEMPPKPGLMPQVAMVALPNRTNSVVMTAPAAAPSAMLLTAPPTPAPPPAEPRVAHARRRKPAEKPVEQVAEKQAEKPVEKMRGEASGKAGRQTRR